MEVKVIKQLADSWQWKGQPHILQSDRHDSLICDITSKLVHSFSNAAKAANNLDKTDLVVELVLTLEVNLVKEYRTSSSLGKVNESVTGFKPMNEVKTEPIQTNHSEEYEIKSEIEVEEIEQDYCSHVPTTQPGKDTCGTEAALTEEESAALFR